MSYRNKFTDLEDLSFLQPSYDFYKDFCRGYWHEDVDTNAMCSLDGSVNDLKLLAFIDYEEQFPDSSLHHASLIWGNVIANHTPLVWAKDPSGILVLISPEDYYPFYVLYPENDFKAAIYSEMPEETPIEHLTLKTYFSMLYSVFFPENLQNFIKLLQELTDIKNTMGTTMMYALKDHFEYLGDTNALSELFEKVMIDYN